MKERPNYTMYLIGKNNNNKLYCYLWITQKCKKAWYMKAKNNTKCYIVDENSTKKMKLILGIP